ncbi:MAG TPA: tetratricopeptide repeat protein [Desulfobacteraceae bacterium]|nr:tetratricopeptide repeat protein [Desulfobacteraceae bacterium]
MIPSAYSPPGRLRPQDFELLQSHFRREIKRLLPVPASPVFWCRKGGGRMPDDPGFFDDDGRSRLETLVSADKPGRINGEVLIPLPLEDGEQVAVLLRDIDPALSEKMGEEWLLELRRNILGNLERIRNDFVHPETGMYSSRLLRECIAAVPTGSRALFFIGAMHRRVPATAGLLNIAQTARLLEASTSGPVFYLGGNIYGILQETTTRSQALVFARKMLGRLKRQGFRRVHIGIAVHDGKRMADGKTSLYDACWRSLETAEGRGPFNLCESSVLGERENHPLAKPPLDRARLLQGAWAGAKKFGLLLYRLEGEPPTEEFSLPDVLRNLIGEQFTVVPVSRSESYVVLPGMSATRAEVWGKELQRRLDGRTGEAPVALGISYWPCLDMPKIVTATNCRRALMHGKFFGPGTATLFDHISLNVSGDHCFDEGDFRQAVRDYQTGLRLAPEDINLMNSLGVALAELNRHRQAIQLFDRVLERESGNFMALVNKGFALRMLGYRDEAIACFERISRRKKFVTSPVFSDISLQLAYFYCLDGRYKKALRLLEKLERVNGDQQGFHLYRLLGEAYTETGQDARGMAALQRAVRLNPHDARSLSTLGELYARAGQGNVIALSLCAKALAIDDKPWKYWYRLALVRAGAGDLAGSVEAIRESLRRNGRDVASLLLAGRVYLEQGAAGKARSMYNRVLKLVPEHHEARRALRKLPGGIKKKTG